MKQGVQKYKCFLFFIIFLLFSAPAVEAKKISLSFMDNLFKKSSKSIKNLAKKIDDAKINKTDKTDLKEYFSNMKIKLCSNRIIANSQLQHMGG